MMQKTIPAAWVPVDEILKITEPFIVYFRVHQDELRGLQKRCNELSRSMFYIRNHFWTLQLSAMHIHNLARKSADGKIMVSSDDLALLERCTSVAVDDALRDLRRQVEHLSRLEAESIVYDTKQEISQKYKAQKRLVAGVVLFVVGIAIVATRYVV